MKLESLTDFNSIRTKEEQLNEGEHLADKVLDTCSCLSIHLVSMWMCLNIYSIICIHQVFELKAKAMHEADGGKTGMAIQRRMAKQKKQIRVPHLSRRFFTLRAFRHCLYNH